MTNAGSRVKVTSLLDCLVLPPSLQFKARNLALVRSFAPYLLSARGRSLTRGQQSLTAQLSQAGPGGDRSHCAQSGFTQGESASRHFHCRGSRGAAPGGRDARQPADSETKRDAEKERGREGERDRARECLPDRRMDRKSGEEKSCRSHPFLCTAPMCLSLRLSPNFSAPPRPSVGCMPPPLLLSSPLPSPYLPTLIPLSSHLSDSLLLPPLFLPLFPSLPISGLGGVHADSGTFFPSLQCL